MSAFGIMPRACVVCKTKSTSTWTRTPDGVRCNACWRRYEKVISAEYHESMEYVKRPLAFPDDLLVADNQPFEIGHFK